MLCLCELNVDENNKSMMLNSGDRYNLSSWICYVQITISKKNSDFIKCNCAIYKVEEGEVVFLEWRDEETA